MQADVTLADIETLKKDGVLEEIATPVVGIIRNILTMHGLPFDFEVLIFNDINFAPKEAWVPEEHRCNFELGGGLLAVPYCRFGRMALISPFLNAAASSGSLKFELDKEGGITKTLSVHVIVTMVIIMVYEGLNRNPKVSETITIGKKGKGVDFVMSKLLDVELESFNKSGEKSPADDMARVWLDSCKKEIHRRQIKSQMNERGLK